MTKLEFLTAFKQACDALPTELVDAAVADFERQFTDQLLTGVPEHSIVERWGTPQHAALKLKVSSFNGNLRQSVNVDKVARVGISGVGLAIMDFFLFFPGLIYLVVLAVTYLAALIVYFAGIFVTASSLAGVNYVDIPAHYLPHDFSMKGSTHLDIGNIDIVPTEVFNEDKSATPAPKEPTSADLPQVVHDRAYHVATHLSKSTIWKGISTTLSGMVLLVLCFLATRFTYSMLRQFVTWHFTVLKNA